MNDSLSLDAARREALESLEQVSLPRRGRSPVYGASILIVAGLTLLLPLLYFSIIGAVCFGLWLHATESTALFDSGSKRGALILYVVPLFVGAMLLVFMIKPLLAKRIAARDRIFLGKDDAPFLWTYVETICKLVGARAPKRILIDSDVNASAGFHSDNMRLFDRGRDLTIGLPLVAGMRLDGLSGILAHEFGHFAQGMGMRASLVIRGVLGWFGRAVYARDSWDERLQRWGRFDQLIVIIAVKLAQGMIWLVRKLLYALLWAGHRMTMFLSRQMEYDADRYKALLIGSDRFCDTMVELSKLSYAGQRAHEDLQSTFRDGRLPDDRVALVIQRRHMMTEEFAAKIEDEVNQEETGPFDTHPGSADRFRAAHRTAPEGQLESSISATLLFDDFTSLCKDMTRMEYEHLLRRRVADDELVPVGTVLQEQAEEDRQSAAFAHFFEDFSYRRIYEFPESLGYTEDQEALVRAIDSTRRRVSRGVKQYEEDLAIAHDDFGKEQESEEEISRRLCAHEEQLMQRLRRSLSLLARDQRGEAEELLSFARSVSQQLVDPVGKIVLSANQAQEILGQVDGLDEEVASKRLRRAQRSLRGTVERAAEAADIPYPFEHAGSRPSLREKYLPRNPHPKTPLPDLISQAIEFHNDIMALYVRAVARLCGIAEAEEINAGLAPLDEDESREQG